MQLPNTTPQTRNPSAVTAAGVKARAQLDGFAEIAILSLAGLTLSLFLIAQGLFPDALALIVAQ